MFMLAKMDALTRVNIWPLDRLIFDGNPGPGKANIW